MRLRTITYTPAAASLAGYKSAATGASWPLTTTTAADNLAHTTTIKNNSATDHSAKTVIITGTDIDGNTITETGNLPAGSATVTYTKYFQTLTTVVPSATIGADTMDIGWTAVSVSPTYPTDYVSGYSNTVSVVVTGTVNFSGEETFQDVQTSIAPSNGNTWFVIAGLSSKTASTTSTNSGNSHATHIKVNSVTAGATLNISYLQSPPVNYV